VAVFAGKRELLTDESVGNAKALLHEQIGRLQVEVGFLREKATGAISPHATLAKACGWAYSPMCSQTGASRGPQGEELSRTVTVRDMCLLL